MINGNNKLRQFFFIMTLLVIVISNVHAQNKNSTNKPNIIYIMVDDLGYGDVGVFFQNQRKNLNDPSKPYHITPYLDKMASNGAMLTQQYCNAPVCAPSRASLLSGLNQGNASVRNNQFDKELADNHTLATVLKTAGYHTIAIGKWGLQGVEETGPYWPAHPLKRGFDYYYGYIRHADGHEHYPAEGIYRGKKEVYENYKNVADGLAKSYTTDLWTAVAKKEILEQVKNSNSGKPFFMYLAYDAPHAVLELPTQAYPVGNGLNGGIQYTGTNGHMLNTSSGTPDSYVYPEYANALYDNDSNPATKEVPWPDTYKRYATMVRRIDDGVGDILQLLKDLKIDDNTLVVFSSDNGASIESYLPKNYVPVKPTFFASNGPFDGIKRDCWEGGIRMPVLAQWPGHIASGRIIETPSMLSDWMATFADVAGVPIPARTNGVSLLPSLSGKGKQKDSYVYVEYFESEKTPGFEQYVPAHRNRKRGEMQVIRMGDFVGVRYNIKSANDDFEIYNIMTDPQQANNLAA
ncbi:MAG: arylsulfatase, partial [Ginsengibacter sp.]